jgi:hypothetical protein
MSIPAVPDASTGAGAVALSEAATSAAASGSAVASGHSPAAPPASPPAPVAETQKVAPSVAPTNTPAPEKVVAPEKAVAPAKVVESAPAVPNDLLEVKLADPGAADHILTYCNTATAGAADQAAVAAGCRHEEASAWTRFVLHNEFPTLDEATRQKCNAPPFPDSYVAKETCAKYQLRIN